MPFSLTSSQGIKTAWGSMTKSKGSMIPFAKVVTDQISTEIYELIIDHLSDDKTSLVACNLVCRSWVPRSKMLLLQFLICRPVPLVSHGGFGSITCAIPAPDHPGLREGGVIYGTTDGVYRGLPDGARPRLFSMPAVSQIEILSDENLFLCLAGGEFITIPLGTVTSGACQDADITRLSMHRPTVAGESRRVCVLKSSSLSTTIKVFDVTGNHQVSTLVNVQESYIPRETCSIRFLSRTRVAVAIKAGGSTLPGGFEVVDLVTLETQSLLDPGDPSLEFAFRKVKPVVVFRVFGTFLVCYDKFAFYIDRNGRMTRNRQVMRWTLPANGFALHLPYILAFCNARVEVWNLEMAEMVQKVQSKHQSPYHLLNAPESGDRVLHLLAFSGDVAEMVFKDAL
ncbi:CNH domain-containing protein [Mycena alexandri]|uniref:CNH domain-containing protein n=1 Tax=Mycena alexandri TaxID=1745969 RepID=A0AAD6S8F0_9AGAR|nr:CNH domain-containing protein [Mycena alexandri]